MPPGAYNIEARAVDIAGLEAFAEPVLGDTAQRRGRGGAPEIFNFSISFGFDPSAARTAAAPQPATDAAG